MNYYDFINSKDVREYLQRINYTLSPIQKAWIVFHSRKPLMEKCAAMNDIILTSDSCRIVVNNHFKYEGSLDFVIKETVKAWQKKNFDFIKAENAFYIYGKMVLGEEKCSFDNSIAFTSFEKCFDAMEKDKGENTYLVSCIPIDNSSVKMTALLDKDLNFISVYGSAEYEKQISKVNSFGVFRYIDVDFPVPFQKGDILQYNDPIFHNRSDCPLVFVKKEKGSNYNKVAGCPCRILPSTSFIGYFYNRFSKRITFDCRNSYMDLEFSNRPFSNESSLETIEKVLKRNKYKNNDHEAENMDIYNILKRAFFKEDIELASSFVLLPEQLKLGGM